MTPTPLSPHLALIIAVLLAVPSAALAQRGSDPVPDAQPPRQSQPPKADPLMGLDEALGLKPAEDRPGETLPLDPAQSELQRRLTGAELADAFIQAADLMDETATRLEMTGDTGIVTQRLQEDILRKLDQLIEAAKQQQQQRSSSRSASSSPGTQPQRRQQANRAGDGENRGQINPPARRDGPLTPGGAGDASTWGALPARVREALSQGQTGRFSALYRSLTEAYYRRLAEEAGR